MSDIDTTDSPIAPFGDGRDSQGRFTSGNSGGPGNPYSRRVAEFKAVLFDAVSDDDLHEIAVTLKEAAKAGNLDAARILMDRLMGRPSQHNVNENVNRDDPDSITHELRQQVIKNAAATEALCNSLNAALTGGSGDAGTVGQS